MIYVSRTELPSLLEYSLKISKIWKSKILTNNGEMVRELEQKLAEYWGVKNVVCVSNGTLATMIAIKALGFRKVYLSPMSYVSTLSVPLWMGLKVKFLDIDEAWKGPAIVTHLYGLPQLVDVPVLYDAAHAFATKVNGKSVLTYGTSIISFHATKIFQTIEGGAVITNDDEVAEKCRWMRNFGHNGQYEYFGVGINCKMNEFQAAMGLCMLPKMDKIVRRYNKIIDRYNKALDLNLEGVSYYPIFYSSEEKLLNSLKVFESQGMFPRRYFYPPLNKIFKDRRCPHAEDLMSRVLSLPLYYSLTKKDQDKVIKVVKDTQ